MYIDMYLLQFVHITIKNAIYSPRLGNFICCTFHIPYHMATPQLWTHLSPPHNYGPIYPHPTVRGPSTPTPQLWAHLPPTPQLWAHLPPPHNYGPMYHHQAPSCLYLGDYTVFLVQFGINLHEWVFQRAEIARAALASAISLFEKLTSAN